MGMMRKIGDLVLVALVVRAALRRSEEGRTAIGPEPTIHITRARSSRLILIFYMPALLFAGVLAWRNGWLLSRMVEAVSLPLFVAVAFGIACGVHVGWRSRRVLPGFVVGAAVTLLLIMAVVASGQALSVDGCIGGERQEQEQAAQDERAAPEQPLVPGSSQASLEESNREEVGAQAEEEEQVEPVDCAVLSETADRRIALVTMRLTLFAAIGTFLFGLVAVFALLVQVRPTDRD